MGRKKSKTKPVTVTRADDDKEMDYYSVEFTIDGLISLYQFKIYKEPTQPPCFIVKEDSKVLECLKVGETHKMKYYTTDTLCPTQYRDTEISRISKEEEGRFKGHYLVGLDIQLGHDGESLSQIQQTSA
jgi:hypothetical protein